MEHKEREGMTNFPYIEEVSFHPHALRRAAQKLADDLHLSGDELAQKIMKR